MKNYHMLTMEQKENIKHGESFFPIQKYEAHLPAVCPHITPHWHEESELTRITKGACIYQIDLIDYEVKKDDLIFIPPTLLHAVSLGSHKEFHSETYVFHMNFLGSNATDVCSTKYLTPMLNREFQMPCIFTKEHEAYRSLRKCFNQIATLYENKPFGYELALKSELLQIAFLILQYSQKNALSVSNDASDKLKTVLDYIELHYSEALSVSELAALCYFSEYHFMRFFKKHMNMTCVEYINNLRLEKSVELFEQGNTSILDVSLSVGFKNLSYFHRAFKKKYNMTPLSFIKKLQ